MLRTTFLCALIVATSGKLLFLPIDEPNLKLGTLLSPKYNAESVAKRVRSWKEGDPRNVWELSGLREGDIIDPTTPGPSRNVIIDQKYNWPQNTVVYKMEAGMLKNEKMAIRHGMDIITNGTCVKFRQATPKDKDYIYIMHSGSGCDSYVGRQGGAQVVHLARNGCMQYAVVAHELLHAIGLDHQHNVVNRDQYVYVNFSNVKRDEYHNFDKDTPDEYTDYGLPYDYHSIMHYSRFAFSKYDPIDYNWGPDHYSMIPFDEDVEIGQQRYVSKLDYLKVNLKYKCPGYGGSTMVMNNHLQTKPGYGRR